MDWRKWVTSGVRFDTVSQHSESAAARQTVLFGYDRFSWSWESRSLDSIIKMSSYTFF